MKNLIVSLFVLSAASAFACPDLKGSYPVCKVVGEDTVYSTDIKQAGGFVGDTIYDIATVDDSGEFRTNEYLADGKEYNYTNSTVTYLATCTDDSLSIKSVLKDDQGKAFLSLIKTYKKIDGKLHTNVQLSNQEEIKILEDSICE